MFLVSVNDDDTKEIPIHTFSHAVSKNKIVVDCRLVSCSRSNSGSLQSERVRERDRVFERDIDDLSNESSKRHVSSKLNQHIGFALSPPGSSSCTRLHPSKGCGRCH